MICWTTHNTQLVNASRLLHSFLQAHMILDEIFLRLFCIEKISRLDDLCPSYISFLASFSRIFCAFKQRAVTNLREQYAHNWNAFRLTVIVSGVHTRRHDMISTHRSSMLFTSPSSCLQYEWSFKKSSSIQTRVRRLFPYLTNLRKSPQKDGLSLRRLRSVPILLLPPSRTFTTHNNNAQP